jgi:hypothetical protein
MGMFDTIKSSYDLGPRYEKELQTKDLDCAMRHYWIDPLGRLFLINDSQTADFVEIKEGDKEYDSKHLWCNFVWVPNGNHGKVQPVYHYGVVEVYPAVWDCKYSSYPSCKIFFRYGIIEEVVHDTQRYERIRGLNVQ